MEWWKRGRKQGEGRIKWSQKRGKNISPNRNTRNEEDFLFDSKSSSVAIQLWSSLRVPPLTWEVPTSLKLTQTLWGFSFYPLLFLEVLMARLLIFFPPLGSVRDQLYLPLTIFSSNSSEFLLLLGFLLNRTLEAISPTTKQLVRINLPTTSKSEAKYLTGKS